MCEKLPLGKASVNMAEHANMQRKSPSLSETGQLTGAICNLCKGSGADFYLFCSFPKLNLHFKS